MEQEEIFKRFILISNLTKEEAIPWQEICSESASEIKDKLKKEDHTEDEIKRLNAAAAALSFYKYTLFKASSESLQVLSIGEISLKNNSRESTTLARIIWENARASISDLLIDQNFQILIV